MPLPKRPRGRLLVGTVLVCVCCCGFFGFWNTLFRYEAYGSITGRIIEVSSPWDGVLKSIHVREGQPVRQGQLLATVRSHDLELQLARVSDEIQIAQATLDSQIAELRLKAQLRDDDAREAWAAYYDLWGELLQASAKLDELNAKVERARVLQDDEAIAAQRVEEINFAQTGQTARVEKLSLAVDEMKGRVDRYSDTATEMESQLLPYLVRIQTLQREIKRLRQQAEQGHIRAPVNGKIIKTRRFTGEFADPSQPIFELLVDGSLQAVVFIPQASAQDFVAGTELNVFVVPRQVQVNGEVVRIGERMERPPINLERHYHKDARLLPVYLQLTKNQTVSQPLRLGSEVRLPANWLGSHSFLDDDSGAKYETAKR